MPARIMIVDDISANALLLEARLTAEYYQTAIAADGFEALRLTKTWQPDLILLDVMMPELNGYEICRRLKSDPRTLHIPIVMVTALAESSERVRGLDAGADDFLTKPVQYDTLLARVRSLVRLKRVLDEVRVRGETARALGLTAEQMTLPSVAGARALVVDDRDAGVRTVQDALSRDGIMPGRAAGEAEAIAMTASVPFDLIVLNLSVTKDDPLRLASRLHATESTHDIPQLLIAEQGQRDLVLRGFDLGVNDWLLSPIDENELRARARNLIRRKFYQDRMRADLGHALEMALTDPLTGFYNQRYLMRHLGGLIAAGLPDGIAVMMVDVDHFKVINDRWGHAVGDRALKTVADTLRSRTRVFDSIARYGGEEFVVVMPGASPHAAKVAADRLRATVEELEFQPEPGVRHRLTVSIGIGSSSSAAITAEEILHTADTAMYVAKRTGRNRVVLGPLLG